VFVESIYKWFENVEDLEFEDVEFEDLEFEDVEDLEPEKAFRKSANDLTP
jgi:hypothetical protein